MAARTKPKGALTMGWGGWVGEGGWYNFPSFFGQAKSDVLDPGHRQCQPEQTDVNKDPSRGDTTILARIRASDTLQTL